MDGEFVFLGTGSSMGVPVIGCHCEVCLSENPKNKRTRAAVYLKVNEKVFLIDAGPDFRSQVLNYKIEEIDGFILTHAHYDHIGGFDDLKAYQYAKNRKVPCLMSEETFEELRIKFSYFIHPSEEDPFNSRFFSWNIVKESFGHITFEGIPLDHVSYFQAGMKVLGVRIGNLAYISDIKQYEEELLHRLQGVEVLIVSALKSSGSEMHFSIEEALAFAKSVGSKKTYFTHIAHEMEYEKTQALLPSNVFLAYDGMALPFKI